MASTSIYRDIAQRTGGDIYIGVVGPVRTGKSTFIRKFMENAVIPNITDEYDRTRAVDELPQAGSGKTVMTTEPKFIPDEAVSVLLGEHTRLRVKMIDCVGYIVPEALGGSEDGEERMVHTPWSETPIPFAEAAEMGTRKVICEHSTIGILVTTDGSIGDIPRESYTEAEERVAHELSLQNKPFAIILNSAHPEREETTALAYELEKKYNAPVALLNCLELNNEDIGNIMELILQEFPTTEMKVSLPEWMRSLESDHWLKKSCTDTLNEICDGISKMGDITRAFSNPVENEYVKEWKVTSLDLADGTADISMIPAEGLYFRIMSELTGFDISDDARLLSLMRELAKTKRAYDKVAGALEQVGKTGYGIVMPDVSELTLQEPEIIKQSGSYGVKLRASAQSIHMIRANIETEINPIVGTEQQSEELVRYMLNEFEENPQKIWESNMFGKSLYELVGEGLHTKLSNMPAESRTKLAETLERIINEGSGGLICIIL
ncbi:MAG: stage IV sporulation protein A [Clostridia bacterium]|nr:stage IV sporulation protein A [Clostridia bacterium]